MHQLTPLQQLNCVHHLRLEHPMVMTLNADCVGKTPKALHVCWLSCTGAKQVPFKCNAALQVLFFEMFRDLGLAKSVPPWYLRVDPKSLKDLPVFAEYEHLPQSRVDARVINQKERRSEMK